MNGQDVLVAFMHPLAAEEGWARVHNQAPGAEIDDSDDALAQPETWMKLAKLIYAVSADKPLENCDRQTY